MQAQLRQGNPPNPNPLSLLTTWLIQLPRRVPPPALAASPSPTHTFGVQAWAAYQDCAERISKVRHYDDLAAHYLLMMLLLLLRLCAAIAMLCCRCGNKILR